MDNFINLAKQGYSAYEASQKNNNDQQQQSQQSQQSQQYQQPQQSQQYQQPQQSQQSQQYQQSQQSVQGGEQFNRPSGENSSFLGGNQVQQPDLNDDEAIRTARKHSNNADDDDSNDNLFATALNFAKTRFANNPTDAAQPVDEAQAAQAHQQAYGSGNSGSMDGQSMAMAAAMQAMKMFTGNSSSGGKGTAGGSSQMIGMAISEAQKLFSQSGGQTSNGASQQSVMNDAGGMIMKLMIQSKMSGMLGGSTGAGAASGGSSQASTLMNLASQFMK